MIKRICIRNYRLFREFDLEFSLGTNIVVGSNETGKSTLIEAINVALTGRLHGKATLAERLAEECTEHHARGLLFESIGDYYSTWFFLNCIDLQHGGRFRAKIFNLRFVRRWNLTYFLYTREGRRKVLASKQKCFRYLEMAVAEFEAANLRADVARASYNLAAKLMLTNHFVRAHRLLLKAKALVDSKNAHLVKQIGELEQRIKDRNRVTPNYVEDLGLDLP